MEPYMVRVPKTIAIGKELTDEYNSLGINTPFHIWLKGLAWEEIRKQRIKAINERGNNATKN